MARWFYPNLSEGGAEDLVCAGPWNVAYCTEWAMRVSDPMSDPLSAGLRALVVRAPKCLKGSLSKAHGGINVRMVQRVGHCVGS